MLVPVERTIFSVRIQFTYLIIFKELKVLNENFQDALPVRLKGTHYLNTPTGFETVFNAIKALLNEKNKKRVSIASYSQFNMKDENVY